MYTNTIRPVARTLLRHLIHVSPREVRLRLRKIHRPLVFWLALIEFQRLKRFDNVSKELLARLTYGWGNKYSAHVDYMAAYLQHAEQSKGPILECGSGLSTLLLGIVADRKGNQVWSLEHNDHWGNKVQTLLHYWRIHSVKLHIDALQRYHGFDWYRLPGEKLPPKFALVVCDGPPGDTYGGRYGLSPVMAEHLGAGTVILLDDCERAAEQAIVEQWQGEIPCDVQVHGNGEKYTVITITQEPGTQESGTR